MVPKRKPDPQAREKGPGSASAGGWQAPTEVWVLGANAKEFNTD